MPTIPLIAPGTVITAEVLNNIFHKCEEFLNGGIRTTDLQVHSTASGYNPHHPDLQGWCKPRHIVKPEFYASPAPKVQMATADVHYRQALESRDHAVYTNDIGDNEFIPIPGLSATFHVDILEVDQIYVSVVVYANFFATEREVYAGLENSGITDGSAVALDAGKTTNVPASIEGEKGICAIFALFHQPEGGEPEEIGGTRRYQHWNFSGFGHKNHSISAMIPELTKGTHSVYVGVKMTVDGTNPESQENFWQTVVGARNMHVEVIYR